MVQQHVVFLRGTMERSKDHAVLKPPSFAFLSLNCDPPTHIMQRPPSDTENKGPVLPGLFNRFSCSAPAHHHTKGSSFNFDFFALYCTYSERNQTCFIWNISWAAANTPSEQIKLISTQTPDRERSFVCTTPPSAEVGTHWGFIWLFYPQKYECNCLWK